MTNPFFKNHGPFKIQKIIDIIKNNSQLKKKNYKIYDIKDLILSTSKDITFFHSKKYSNAASITKASYCITTDSLKHFLPVTCSPIIVENVLLSVSLITKAFYPDSINDEFDNTVREITKTNFNKKTRHGKNILIGKK